MTENDTILRLLHITESPECYDDHDIDQALSENDFIWLSRIAGAFAMSRPSAVAAESAWEELVEVCQPSQRHQRWSIAAVIIGFVLLSGLTFAAIRLGLFHSTQELQAPPTTNIETIDIKKPTDLSSPEQEKTVVFENKPLEDVLLSIAKHHHANVSFRQEGIKSLRLYYEWDVEQPLDAVINDLNHFNSFHLTIEQENIIAE
ncbi:MAG: DUF4974 domain-containing protein [Prevotella sp.]|nr:DUF4974 domain-containing protein [Prevotella sp.]MBR5652753.1 DUF4974 domain-containing protein [Prevotella sp.]